MTRVTPIIQARTGSTRLPGKVMYPLDGLPALEHVITRTAHADSVNNVVVATSTESQDDVIAQYAPTFGADVIRGSESDVLSRFEYAVGQYDPEFILRVTGDCPLISPQFIDASIERVRTTDVDYVCAGLNRTFPRGITCEAFTAESFERVIEQSSEPRHSEHVTPYYRENPEDFELYNLESNELFEEEWLQNRTDLRLTLDEPADYQLLETVYRELTYKEILDIRDAIRHIDQNGLAEVNHDVEQKSV
ncbi:glycosyltransferase family protein [Natronomonas gomsonensis]|uniref:glycosyltransferase family protein n=1 Tax=Natronomonas gomsonensis TaxID=1046043 RepID=UPI00227A3C48|nr:glycosyltransferase family protein [Natronomonas gomsonensis]MCY4732130.1 glycosyltransferase family protein [Natronomonas gomsonensis]